MNGLRERDARQSLPSSLPMWGGMQSGQVFGDGEYEIVSSAPIGKGSGGTVYRGRRRATNTPVAVKCIDRLEVDCDPQKVQQLEREMNIAIKLRHQNIVNLLDVKFEEEVRAHSNSPCFARESNCSPPEPGTPCGVGGSHGKRARGWRTAVRSSCRRPHPRGRGPLLLPPNVRRG